MTKPKSSAVVEKKAVGPCTNGLFTLYSAKNFPSLPEMTWLIEDVFPSTGLASVYGASGIGKSFLCLDMAASVARGMPWFGHPTTQDKVVYIVLEGQAGFRRRVAAWEKHHGVEFPENVKFVFDQFSITDANHTMELGDLINQCEGES